MASGGDPDEIKKTDDKTKTTKRIHQVESRRVAQKTTEHLQVTRISRQDDRRRQRSEKSGSESKYNKCTNIIINGKVKNMQIGNNNTMVINTFVAQASRPTTRQQLKDNSCPRSTNELTESEQEKIQKLKDSTEELSAEVMMAVSKIIGGKYRRYGRKLGFSDAKVEDIYESKSGIGAFEVMYTLVREWKKKTPDPSVGKLVQTLSEGEDAALIKSILKHLEVE